MSNPSGINVTTVEIDRSINKYTDEYNNKKIEYKEYNRFRYNIEYKTFLGESVAQPIENVIDNLSKIDTPTLKDNLDTRFYDPNFMMVANEVTNAIFYRTDNNGLTEAKIKYYLKGLKQIGANSVEGYALLSDVDYVRDVLVVKSPRKPKIDDLLHEWFIGTKALNNLRASIPNFAYIFGAFRCKPPLLQDKEVITWCNADIEENRVSYVAYENVSPAITFREYCSSCTFNQYLSILLQVSYAINVAGKEYKFTHYDLHDENVLIRGVSDENFYIKYPAGDGYNYVLSNSIATIIDYGLSYVELPESENSDRSIPFSVKDSRSKFSVGLKYNPMFDIYKILLMSMNSLKNRNQSVYEQAKPLLEFFSNEDPDQVLDDQLSNYYSLTVDMGPIDAFNFIQFIHYNFNPDFISLVTTEPDPDIRILGCLGTDICFSKNEYYDELDLVYPLDLSNTLDYYNMSVSYITNNQENELKIIDETIDYQELVSADLQALTEILQNIADIEIEPITLDLNGLISDELYEYLKDMLDDYREYFNTVIYYYNLHTNYTALLNSIHYISYRFNYVEMLEDLKRYSEDNRDNRILIDSYLNSIMNDIYQLKSLPNVDKVVIANYSDTNWYMDVLMQTRLVV